MKILRPSKDFCKQISDLSIILYLHHCTKLLFVNIPREKLEMYSKSLKKDDKVTPQVACFIANICFIKSARTLICCPELYFFFKYS